MDRKEYGINIVVNGIKIKKVIIDPHYRLKHASSISESLILELVEFLDGGDFIPEEQTEKFDYFVTDHILLRGKRYKLVWLIEKSLIYIGVVNAYRRKK